MNRIFSGNQRFAFFLYTDWRQYLRKWHINTIVISKQWPLVLLFAGSTPV